MRTLYEIIDSAKEGQVPTHDECYWAMLALSALHHFDHQTIRDFGSGRKDINGIFGIDWEMNESFNRFKKALGVPPKKYVGWSNDPSNPQYQERRKIFLNILNEVEERIDHKEDGDN